MQFYLRVYVKQISHITVRDTLFITDQDQEPIYIYIYISNNVILFESLPEQNEEW